MVNQKLERLVIMRQVESYGDNYEETDMQEKDKRPAWILEKIRICLVHFSDLKYCCRNYIYDTSKYHTQNIFKYMHLYMCLYYMELWMEEWI